MATIFTKIINREIPATIVFENDKVLAFKDINPLAPVHILVIPKKEIATINDIKEEDKELIGEIFLAIGKIVKDLGIDKEGYRVVANCNEYGGQEVFHLHYHILGGKKLGTTL
ncbi:histidine triad nucleotide-binding protein [Fusobacterium sp.]|uniref:histidine triad nucleotide-binding protein n=1 Tax=Fusobacterium sp. TaxID=68766 RepID=UPI00396C97F1